MAPNQAERANHYTLTQLLIAANTVEHAALVQAQTMLQRGELGPDGQVLVDTISTNVRRLRAMRARLDKDMTN